jgi:hypothetical protein
MSTHEDIPRCECTDMFCYEHRRHDGCKGVGVIVLYEVGTNDTKGTLFCEGCVVDALDSGLFVEYDAPWDRLMTPEDRCDLEIETNDSLPDAMDDGDDSAIPQGEN